MPKTGSSSIQEALHRYRTSDTSYAPFLNKNHGHAIAACFSKNPRKLREFFWREATADVIEKDIAGYRASIKKMYDTPKNYIISGESILDLLDNDEFSDMVANLRTGFDRIIPIVYVRPIMEMGPSQLQQRIKMGQSNLTIPSPKYIERLTPLIGNFDRDEIVFRKFCRSSLHEGDVVQDFAKQVGILPIEKRKSSNETLSSEALGAIMSFNIYVAPLLRRRARTQLRRELESSLKAAGSTKFGLSRSLLEQHCRKYAEEVKWAEDLCGFELIGEYKCVESPISSIQELLDLCRSADSTP